MKSLTSLTIEKARTGLLNKEFSSVEITKAFLDRISKYENLNAYITVTSEKAIEQAKKADKMISKGNTEQSLLGIPLAIKDLFCTKGTRTTAGSKMLEDFIPPYESTVSQNLLDEGAVFLGKANMDEFAMGSANITSYFGRVELNMRKKSAPSDPLVPGGSSGGPAAAVAADLAIAATGSDTGGSIRQPASFCGLVGIKPTYGLCSRWGMVAFASSLDQAGPLSKTVTDSAIMLKVMAGYDPKDSTSLNVKIPNYVDFVGKSIKGMKIGIAKQYLEGLESYYLDVLEETKRWLIEAGAEIVDIDLQTIKYALPAYYIIAPAEASSNLARYDGVKYGSRVEGKDINDLYKKTRAAGFGNEVKTRIMTGTYVLSSGFYDAYYMRALKIRKMIENDFRDNAFSKVDLILSITTPNTAFGFNDTIVNDPIKMYLNDIFTVPANIAGLPGISVPAALSEENLPIGVQLIGPKFSEGKMFSVAAAIEKAANFAELKKKILTI